MNVSVSALATSLVKKCECFSGCLLGHVCVHVHMCVEHARVCIAKHVCTYLCVHVNTHIAVHVRVHAHMHTRI